MKIWKTRQRGLLSGVLMGLVLLSISGIMVDPLNNTGVAALQLDSAEVDLWPEYDRPEMLVVLQGEIASEGQLPLQIAISLPAGVSAPHALAARDTLGHLISLGYDLEQVDGRVVVQFILPHSRFQLEYYDTIVGLDQPQREYTYIWNGDAAVERLVVKAHSPATARDLAIELVGLPAPTETLPDVAAVSFVDLPLGYQAAVRVVYQKEDRLLSIESGQLQPVVLRPDLPVTMGEALNLWPLALSLVLVGGVAVVVGIGISFRMRSEQRRVVAVPMVVICPVCGTQNGSSERFCRTCGNKLR